MAHTYTRLLYHAVSSTHQRKALFNPKWMEELKAFAGGIVREMNGTMLAMHGPADHMHFLLSLSPVVAVSDAMRDLKRATSTWIRDRAEASFQWQEGYSAFSVSRSAEQDVRTYILRQVEHHQQRTFAEELKLLLEAHGVDYDPRYFLK